MTMCRSRSATRWIAAGNGSASGAVIAIVARVSCSPRAIARRRSVHSQEKARCRRCPDLTPLFDFKLGVETDVREKAIAFEGGIAKKVGMGGRGRRPIMFAAQAVRLPETLEGLRVLRAARDEPA